MLIYSLFYDEKCAIHGPVTEKNTTIFTLETDRYKIGRYANSNLR